MIITEEIKQIIRETAFLSLITLNPDGTPHPIIAGKGEVSGDSIEFGIYKMEKTQANLRNNKNAWVVGATLTEGKPKGIRLIGTAAAQDKKLIFSPAKAEPLL
jgi:hypothetical protein